MAERRTRPRARRRGALTLTLLLALTTALAVSDLTDGDDPGAPVSRLRAGAATVLGPAQSGADRLAGAGSAAWAELSGSGEAELGRLRRENAELAARAAAAQDELARAEALGPLATAAAPFRTVTARALGVRAGDAGAWTATLDLGSDDGVAASSTVLAAGGLVGRVRAVTASTSEVLLLADPRSGVGVRVERTGQLGTARGSGEPGTLDLVLLDPGADLSPGDRVVTLGSDGGRPFVPGVGVGEVVSVQAEPGSLTRSATLRLAVDPTRLDLVAVVRP